jgi:hypothetical protein
MQSVRFGVDGERFIGSAIVFLNQLAKDPHPERDYGLGADCNTKLKDLKLRFQRERWRPDLQEYRLKAEVTGSALSEISTKINNARSKLLEDGREYPIIKRIENQGVHITDGIPLLQCLRSFKPPVHWCIVNFYCDGELPPQLDDSIYKDHQPVRHLTDGHYCRGAILKNSHQAVLRKLSASDNQSNEPSLTSHHITALNRVRKRPDLLECLEPFMRSTTFFLLTPKPFWDNMLRSWCSEVCSHLGMRTDHV